MTQMGCGDLYPGAILFRSMRCEPEMVARALEWLDVEPEDRVLTVRGMGNLHCHWRQAASGGCRRCSALAEKASRMLSTAYRMTFYCV